MLVKTRYFGEVDLDETKIIDFETGIIGFENLRKFTLIYNNEDGSDTSITWLQSIEEQAVALPVINPLTVKSDYNPEIEDEILKKLGDFNETNTCVFVTLTAPADVTKMTVNLKAPIIINADTRRGRQVITESDYPVKYNIYEVVQKQKAQKGEN